jgi:hypothetical protein
MQKIQTHILHLVAHKLVAYKEPLIFILYKILVYAIDLQISLYTFGHLKRRFLIYF